MKELTREQIEKIGNFCEDWGVNYYDVKVELVDHISTTVEILIAENPQLTFDDAFLKARRSFGEIGFEQIIREKEKAISRNGRKQQLQYLLGFFTLPKILLTIGYILVCYLSIQYLSTVTLKYISLAILTPPLVLLMTSLIFYSKADYFMRSVVHYHNQKLMQIRPLLIFSRKNNLNFLGGMILPCMNLIFLSGVLKLTHPEWIASTILFALVGLVWISYGAFKHQKDLLIYYAIKNYPDAFELKPDNHENA
ncbi:MULTISPECIES: hypothetical protein [Chitinophagaceae]